MPTTEQEAIKILGICLRHKIPLRSMLPLFRDLHLEVGEVSENDSVKATMKMLYEGANSLLEGCGESMEDLHLLLRRLQLSVPSTT